MITFYGYKKCNTCRNAEKKLESKGIAYTFVDITVSPPTQKELAMIQKSANIPVTKLFNTSGVVYREQNIKEKIKGMSDDSLFHLLASDGKLIKRPLVTDGSRSTVGFNEEIFEKTWS